MRKATFLEQCEALALALEQQNSQLREPKTVQEHIAIDLWKLATPGCYRFVGNTSEVGKSTAGTVVMEVSKAIYTVLAPRVVKLGNILK